MDRLAERESAHPPLAGVRVVQIGAFMAAPYAAMQLADLTDSGALSASETDSGEGTSECP